MPTKVKTHAFSLGFDHGNYAAAYETTDFARCSRGSAADGLGPIDAQAYEDGLILGFFSSYELFEIEPEHRDTVEGLRTEYGEEL